MAGQCPPALNCAAAVLFKSKGVAELGGCVFGAVGEGPVRNDSYLNFDL